jgi:hypothetical protein
MDNLIRGACLLALLLVAGPVLAVAPIPTAEVAALQRASEAARAAKPGSAEQRRACKRVVRSGKSLGAAHPDAPDRFELLGVMLRNQKIVLKLETNDRNRDVLYGICSQLAGAPDEWAEARLEADLLLSERDLSARDASLEERADALVAVIERYRGTEAEAKSLMIGAVIAKNLESGDLLRFIEQTMDERCAGNPEVIVFRRNVLDLKSLAVKCQGSYTRSDGTTLYIPGDRMGHQCLLVYWAQESPGSERFMKQVKEQQELFPGAFEVYSFNLDELPDAGEKALREMGLDWHAMHLPNGKRNVAYQAYGAANPTALFINGYGYTVLNPFGANPDAHVGVMGIDGGIFKISESRLSHERYLAQLQSLIIGDFLMWERDENRASKSGVPTEVLNAIQSCFVAPPLRYRLTREEALENYEKAEKLCGDAIGKYPNASALWMVRNRRIIALLGMWNLVCEPRYLEQAVAEAKAALATELPPGAGVVPQFCLAKQALRTDEPDVTQVLADLIETTGGSNAPLSAVAAASILALDANSRDLHEAFRAKLLDRSADGNSALWPVTALLRNRYHRFFLLKPNSTRGDRLRSTRGYIVNHGDEPSTERLPEITLKGLDGKDVRLPLKNNDKLTLLLFVEPPADPEADFPVVLDRSGKPTENDHIRKVVNDASMLAATHVNEAVDVILAFLCDDAARVSALMEKNGWTGQPALVPGGLGDPLVHRLGIFSADRVPNVFLLRRNGSIAWHASGLRYKSEYGYPFAFLLGMKVHIEACEVEHGYKALARGDYGAAARIFAGPFLPANPDRYGWQSPRYHGKAVALMGSKDLEAALESIDGAIDAHKLQHFREYGRRRSKSPLDWRKDAALVTIKAPCDIYPHLWDTKAAILDELGRKDEAAELRKRLDEPVKPHPPSLYGQFHEKLTKMRERGGRR